MAPHPRLHRREVGGGKIAPVAPGSGILELGKPWEGWGHAGTHCLGEEPDTSMEQGWSHEDKVTFFDLQGKKMTHTHTHPRKGVPKDSAFPEAFAKEKGAILFQVSPKG